MCCQVVFAPSAEKLFFTASCVVKYSMKSACAHLIATTNAIRIQVLLSLLLPHTYTHTHTHTHTQTQTHSTMQTALALSLFPIQMGIVQRVTTRSRSFINALGGWHSLDINNQSWNPMQQSSQLSTGANQYHDEATCPSGTPYCLVCSMETELDPILIPLRRMFLNWSFSRNYLNILLWLVIELSWCKNF